MAKVKHYEMDLRVRPGIIRHLGIDPAVVLSYFSAHYPNTKEEDWLQEFRKQIGKDLHMSRYRVDKSMSLLTKYGYLVWDEGEYE